MKPKTYVILERAVEEGARLGYNRAFKHNENPSEEAIVESVVDGVMLSISEVFAFNDDYDGESYK